MICPEKVEHQFVMKHSPAKAQISSPALRDTTAGEFFRVFRLFRG
jgi:hypothetical protein